MMGSLLEMLAENISWPTLILTVATVILYYVYTKWWSLPHGPMGLPYLGYYPYLSNDFGPELGELAKKYGEVFCFRSTGQLYVHLNSLRAIKEAFITKSECFMDRNTSFTVLKELFGDGVLFENGEPWKILRKFFLQVLREFGMGKDVQESVVMDRVQHTLNVLKQSDGKKVNIFTLFTENSSFVIRQILFSSGKIDNQDCKIMNDAYLKIGKFFDGRCLLLAGPVARRLIFSFMQGYKEAMEGKETMKTTFYKIIKQHEDTFDKHHLRDMVDYYINERRSLREKGDPMAKTFTDSALVHSMIQFFGDGGFAVSLLTCQAFKELSNYPDIQRKIQFEIDEIVGRERLPNWSDRSRMPYTAAVIYESQRVLEVLKALPTTQCAKETFIQGKRVPKGSIAVMNLWSVHHDPELYKDPYKFDPSRFISTKKDQKAKVELPILFGVGKRACIGESLTSMQVFLSVVGILQNFSIRPVEKVIYEEGIVEIAFTPRTT